LSLSDHEGRIQRLLDRYDDLAPAVALDEDAWVVTHGEPHGANQIRTGRDEFVLVDWDTAAIGPRERDLWMVEPKDEEDWAAYTSAGAAADINPAALELYRLWWTLTELSLSTSTFRSSHSVDENTRVSWAGFESELAKLADG
jgi:aminoglycoside phosphotransferase (APT) family kinase protein